MSRTNIIINTVDSTAMVIDQLQPQSSTPTECLSLLGRYIDGLANGNFYFTTVTEQVGAVQATATITSTGSAVNNETMSLANVTLTAKTSGAVPASGQFNISATVAIQATSIALAINSTPALVGIVTATSNAGIVTVTASHAGLSGNAIQMSEALTNVTVTQFASGSNGTTAVLR